MRDCPLKSCQGVKSVDEFGYCCCCGKTVAKPTS